MASIPSTACGGFSLTCTLHLPMQTMKNLYLSRRSDPSSSPGVLVPLACGTISSTCGQLASYPFSLLRTRFQAQSECISYSCPVHAYNHAMFFLPPVNLKGPQATVTPGIVDTLQNIVREEGYRGLYRGILPNFLKVIPAVSIGYVMYEQLKLLLGVETVR